MRPCKEMQKQHQNIARLSRWSQFAMIYNKTEFRNNSHKRCEQVSLQHQGCQQWRLGLRTHSHAQVCLVRVGLTQRAVAWRVQTQGAGSGEVTPQLQATVINTTWGKCQDSRSAIREFRCLHNSLRHSQNSTAVPREAKRNPLGWTL